MADIFRAPLFAGRREVAPVLQLGAALVLPALLGTLLAVAPPFVNAPHSAPSTIAKCGWLPADTTSPRSPLVLRTAGAKPFSIAPHFTPNAKSKRGWLPGDTTQDSPVWLIPAGPPPLPVGAATPLTVARVLWQPADTTADTPKSLTADARVPFFVPPAFAPVSARTLPSITWQGTPFQLFPVAILPLPPGEAAPLGAPERPRQAYDTSRGVWTGLLEVPLPPGAFSWPVAPARPVWLPDDTTSSTPKPAIADAQLPISNPQHTAPDRRRPVADTSQSAFAAAHPVVVLPLPPGKVAGYVSHRYRFNLADTSASMPLVIAAPVVATAALAAYQRPRSDSARPASPTAIRFGSPNTRRY